MTTSTKWPRTGVGVCIYCGRKPSQCGSLDREHTMPFLLNGPLALQFRVLQKASCKECANKTKEFEQRLTRGVFLPLRVVTKSRSRTGLSRTGFPLIDKTTRRRHLEHTIEIKNIPWLAIVQRMLPPRCILGTGPALFQSLIFNYQFVENPEFIKMDDSDIRADLRYSVTWQNPDIYRLYAKIAYCEAIYIYGYEDLESDLPSYILGKAWDYNYLVGEFSGRFPISAIDNFGEPSSKPILHKVCLLHDNSSTPRVACLIRLFTKHNFPRIEVVVGNLKRPSQ